MCLVRSIFANLCPIMIHFNALDFNVCRFEEVISFFWRSVYIWCCTLFVFCERCAWSLFKTTPSLHTNTVLLCGFVVHREGMRRDCKCKKKCLMTMHVQSLHRYFINYTTWKLSHIHFNYKQKKPLYWC